MMTVAINALQLIFGCKASFRCSFIFLHQGAKAGEGGGFPPEVTQPAPGFSEKNRLGHTA